MKHPLWDPITKQVQSQEFIDGRNARFNGKTVEDACPYLFGDEPFNIRWHDWICGWSAADTQLEYNAEVVDKMKNSTPLPEDEFVKELEALLTKYNYRITSVNNDRDLLYFKSGSHKRYDFAVPTDDGAFVAARPLGG